MRPSRQIVIEPGMVRGQYWMDLWSFRELFLLLAWRDILVRYKQTIIGIAWSVIRPLLTMAVFTIVFGRLAGMPSEGAPYPILVFAAMLPWQMFATALMESSNSLIDNSALLSKVYFPRLIIPASSVLVSLVDFLISFALLGLLMAYYQHAPGYRLVFVPFFLGMAFMSSLGLGLLFASLNVKYRDFRYIVPFVVQLGLYISPVGFSSAVIPEEWRWLYSLNPMVGVIDGFRWAILNSQTPLYQTGVVASVCMAVLFFLIGLYYFRRAEKHFADVI